MEAVLTVEEYQTRKLAIANEAREVIEQAREGIAEATREGPIANAQIIDGLNDAIDWCLELIR